MAYLSLGSYAPKGICDAIYGHVPGATFDSAMGYWKVPCGIEINMAFRIASVFLFLSFLFFLTVF